MDDYLIKHETETLNMNGKQWQTKVNTYEATLYKIITDLIEIKSKWAIFKTKEDRKKERILKSLLEEVAIQTRMANNGNASN